MTTTHLTRSDAAAVCEDAYVFAYPLVLMELCRRRAIATREPDPATMRAPLNQLVHARGPGEAGARPAMSPNAGTLSTSAWLDLAEEPIVLSVPDTHGRYYVMSLVDMWTNTFMSVGARTTGTRSGAYAIGMRRWNAGALPAGVLPIAAPTRFVRIAGRTCVEHGEPDAGARAVQHGYGLMPLSRWPERSSPPADPTALNQDGDPAPAGALETLDGMDPMAFFGLACRLLRENPPRPEDRHMVDRAEPYGLLRDGGHAWMAGDPDLQRRVQEATDRARAAVRAEAGSTLGEPCGLWRINYRRGRFGTNYLRRAAAARASVASHAAADALRALTRIDAEGRALTGSHRYQLRFPPGGEPPVHGFWALSTQTTQAHGTEDPGVEDSISLGDRDGLKIDGDGSLPIAIQCRSPGRGLRSNWLPAPAGEFAVVLRLHWPRDEVLDRRWTPPAVTRVD